MKILFCEIENYGNVTGGKRVTFDGGLQEFCEKNGYGKTTLCSFIRVMFYGMPTKKEKSVSFGDREHFYPFSGGKFGGSLTFSYGGKICRIERFFDEKTATKDSFTYYEDGEEVKRNADTFGKEIFGIDEEAFLRSLSFDAAECVIAASDGMREKLGAIVEGTDGGRGAADALAILEKKRKEIKGDRKNANSEIVRYENEKSELLRAADELYAEAKKADLAYAEREQIKNSIETLEKEEAALSARRDAVSKKEAYLHYAKQAAEKESRLREIERAYGGSVFSASEIERLREKKETLSRVAVAIENKRFEGAKVKNLESLKAAFAVGVPTEGDLSLIARDVEKLAFLDAEIAAMRPAARDSEVYAAFSGKENARADVLRVQENCGKLNRLRAEKAAREEEAARAAAERTQKGEKSGKKGLTLLGIFCLALCALGVVVSFALSSALPTVLSAAIAVLSVCLFTAKTRKQKSDSALSLSENRAAEERLMQLRDEAARLEAETRGILALYGYGEGDLFLGASLLYAACDEYASVVSRTAALKAQKAQKIAEKEDIQKHLAEYFSRYRLSGDAYSENLSRLKNGVARYQDLSEEYEQTQKERAELQKTLAETEAEIRFAFAQKGAQSACTENLAISVERAADASAEAARLKKDVEAHRRYLAEQGVSPNVLGEGEETSALLDARIGEAKVALAEKRRALTLKEDEIAKAERAAAAAERKETAAKAVEEKIREAEQRLKIYRVAEECLLSADERMLKRYVEPVRERFVRYAALIEETLGIEVSMNKDFSLSFLRGSAKRKDAYLSAGVRSVCAFCLRLALIDEMFSGREQPFLVLDDPFVHLDEEHFSKTASLVKKLAAERQFLYFTCHPSRSVISEGGK